MTDLRPLQQGRLRRSALIEQRRRARRRRLLWRATLAIVLVVAATLALMAPATSRNSRIPQPPPAAAKRTATVVPRPVYGRRPAAATVRRGVHRALRGNAAMRQPPRSGLLFDVRTGDVLWARHPERRLPIASLTKMMTALVVADDASAGTPVLITRQALHYSGSGVGMLPLGKRVPERALLYGLLLPSGNDAAIALAEHVAGTRPRFIAMMNARARAMGLRCTHYSTVSGVVDHDNYSCAADLAVVARALLGSPVLARIVASAHAAPRFPIKGGRLFLNNNNPLLMTEYPGADGVKTGYTTAAGLCIVATAKRKSRWLGVVLLHSPNWTTQAEALLNAGFAATAG